MTNAMKMSPCRDNLSLLLAAAGSSSVAAASEMTDESSSKRAHSSRSESSYNFSEVESDFDAKRGGRSQNNQVTTVPTAIIVENQQGPKHMISSSQCQISGESFDIFYEDIVSSCRPFYCFPDVDTTPCGSTTSSRSSFEILPRLDDALEQAKQKKRSANNMYASTGNNRAKKRFCLGL